MNKYFQNISSSVEMTKSRAFARTLYFLLFLFSYALIFFNFENRRFSFVFPSVWKNLQFSLKTEGFLNHKSYGKASVFF